MSDSLFAELKRRNVFKVVAGYILLGWLVLQVADVVVPILELPEWTLKLLLFLGLIGFPFAMFFAWAYELTPDGIKREHEVDRDESITTATGQKLNYIVIALLVMALGYFIYERQAMRSTPEQPNVVTQQSEAANGDVRPSIAVLPLTNMSGDDANLPFTMGIHDDLLTHISRIKALKTTSRTSVLQYADTTKTIPQIGKELNVSSILEGSIQRAGNQIRINMQLIDTATDEHIWADIFNRELTTENLFEVQGEIAQAVADALRVALLPEEKAAIASAPTASMESYDLYLLGRHEWNQRTADSLTKAKDYFEQAIEADPTFVKAMSGLADSYLMLVSYDVMTGEEGLPKAKEQIDSAMAIDDSVSEVWASLGSYYSAKSKPIDAEKAYLRAIELDDKNAMAWLWYGTFLNRNDVRRYEDSIAAYEKAYELEPMHRVINRNMSIMYDNRGQFERATKHANNAIAARSPDSDAFEQLNTDRLRMSGNIAQAVYHYREILAKDPSSNDTLLDLADSYVLLGDYETAMLWATRADDLDARPGAVTMVLREQGDYQGAIDNTNQRLEIINDRYGFGYLSDMFSNLELMGEPQKARVYLDELYNMLRGNIKANPWDRDPRGPIYFAYFWLRHGSDEEKERANQLLDEVISNTENLISQGFMHPDTLISISLAHFIKGNNKEGVKYLDQAIDKGFRSRLLLQFAPRVHPSLAQDPEFLSRFDRIDSLVAIESAKLEKMSLADYIPLRRDVIEIARDTLEQYEGYFTNGNSLWHFYINEQGDLMMQVGQRRLEKLLAIGVNMFYPEKSVDVTFEFVADENGAISHVELNDDTIIRLKRFKTPPSYITLPIATLKKYEGTYSYISMPDDPNNSKNFVWTGVISVNEKGEVWFDLNNQPALILEPYALHQFDMPGFTATMTFFFDDGPEKASRVIFYGDGNELIFNRDE